MREPYCPHHHPRTYSQCGCPLPKPPAKPLLADVCRWCLTGTYAAPFCRQFGHWRMIMGEYERDLARWQETYGAVVAERRTEKMVAAPKPDLKREAPTPAPRVSRPAVVEFPIPTLPHRYFRALGQRGGRSRSEKKIAASRLNGQRGGRRRTLATSTQVPFYEMIPPE